MPPILPPESPLSLVHPGVPSEAGWGVGGEWGADQQTQTELWQLGAG